MIRPSERQRCDFSLGKDWGRGVEVGVREAIEDLIFDLSRNQVIMNLNSLVSLSLIKRMVLLSSIRVANKEFTVNSIYSFPLIFLNFFRIHDL